MLQGQGLGLFPVQSCRTRQQGGQGGQRSTEEAGVAKGRAGRDGKRSQQRREDGLGRGGKRRAEKPDGAGVAEGGKAGGRPKAGDPNPESRENTVTMTVLPTYPPKIRIRNGDTWLQVPTASSRRHADISTSLRGQGPSMIS